MALFKHNLMNSDRQIKLSFRKDHHRSFPGLAYLFILLFLLISSAIQVMFKYIALGLGGGNYFVLFQEPLFYFCGLIFMAQAVLWLAVLRKLPLSRAYPFTSLTVIIMLASGALFFGEPISLGNMLGAVVIMTGVIVIAGDNNKENADNLGC